MRDVANLLCTAWFGLQFGLRPLVNKTRSTFRNDFRSDVTLPFTTNHVLVASLFHCSTSSKVVWTPKQLRKVVFRGEQPFTTFRHLSSFFCGAKPANRNRRGQKGCFVVVGKWKHKKYLRNIYPFAKRDNHKSWPFGDVASKSCFEKLVLFVDKGP